MKRIVGFMLILGLIAGLLAAPAMAKKKKPRKPAVTQVDQKYYLRRDACNTDADNAHLSVLDGEDASCTWVDAGIPWELYSQSGLIEPGESYPATDGVPFVFDASKPITGEITIAGDSCVQDPACLPEGTLAAGQATFTLHAFAEVAGEEKDLGTFEDTFTITPADKHTSKVSLPIDPSLNGLSATAFRFDVFFGGEAVGAGGITYEDPASFITVPTLVTK